jgi:hypothetical protein
VTTPAAAIGTPSPAMPAWRRVIDAWRMLRPRHVRAAFLLGLAYFLYEQADILWIMVRPGHPRWLLLAVNFVQDELAAMSLLACVAVAHRVCPEERRRAGYVVAIVVSAAIVGLLEMVPRATTLLYEPDADPAEIRATLVDALWGGSLRWLILGGAATFIYADRRRTAAARARRHAAELERALAAKRTIESKLQAMQARVEPQFLFNTLAGVRAQYRAGPARGAAMLDSLIAYLRAAMPRMRDTSSTLGQETALAGAYLDIVAMRDGDALAVHVDVPADAASRRFPPMLLLPLIDVAVRQRHDAGARRTIAIAATSDAGRVRVSIDDSGAGYDPVRASPDIDAMRERLAALFGDGATLTLERGDRPGTRAILDVTSPSTPRA